jgi:hypothetical protein
MVLQMQQQGRPLHIAREPNACSIATTGKGFSPHIGTPCDNMQDTAEQHVDRSSNQSPAKLGRVHQLANRTQDPRRRAGILDTRGGGSQAIRLLLPSAQSFAASVSLSAGSSECNGSTPGSTPDCCCCWAVGLLGSLGVGRGWPCASCCSSCWCCCSHAAVSKLCRLCMPQPHSTNSRPQRLGWHTQQNKNATGIDGWLAGDFDRPHT